MRVVDEEIFIALYRTSFVRCGCLFGGRALEARWWFGRPGEIVLVPLTTRKLPLDFLPFDIVLRLVRYGPLQIAFDVCVGVRSLWRLPLCLVGGLGESGDVGWLLVLVV